MTTYTSSRGGMRDVLRVALPLIIASSGHAIRLASDRIMLSHLPDQSLAASMPAGLATFVIICFFLGVAGYANTFVAQYTGARRPERVGIAVWQALYLSLIGGALVAAIAFATEPIIRAFGHDPEIQVLEVPYFRILCCFGWVPLLTAGLNSFWSGRGKTMMVVAIELTAAFLNVVLNWVLIFGNLGFAQMGIEGAAYATGLSGICGLTLGFVVFFLPSNRRTFGTFPARTFDPDLFWRLIRFGSPAGVQFFLDLAAFQVFVVLMGRYGSVEAGALTIAFSLNALAFIPLSGLGIATGVLVGQAIGEKDIPHAWKAVRSSFFLSVIYNLVLMAFFLGAPDLCLSPFFREDAPRAAEVLAMARTCLVYISAYLVFDGLVMIYGSALRGAGDTFWCMVVGTGMSWFLFALPACGIYLMGGTVWDLWGLLVGCVLVMGAVYYLRFRGGKWQHMKVIEDVPPVPNEFEAAVVDYERG